MAQPVELYQLGYCCPLRGPCLGSNYISLHCQRPAKVAVLQPCGGQCCSDILCSSVAALAALCMHICGNLASLGGFNWLGAQWAARSAAALGNTGRQAATAAAAAMASAGGQQQQWKHLCASAAATADRSGSSINDG